MLNFRRNIIIVVLLVLLAAGLKFRHTSSKEVIWSVAIVLVVKAESRPQSHAVLFLAIAVTVTALLAASNYRGSGSVWEGLSVILLIPLVLSKWLFALNSPSV